MFVQRLLRRLRQLVASLFHHHAADPLTPERTAVLTATHRSGPGSGATTSAASWLDDSRRLRPRPSPLAKLDQQWSPHTAGSARQPVPTPPPGGRATPIRPASDQPPAEAARPQHIEPVTQPLPPRAPSRPDQRLPVPSGSTELSDQLLYRRLMGLKRLVRLGIYNEGFASTGVPEQYRHSLGYEDDLSAD